MSSLTKQLAFRNAATREMTYEERAQKFHTQDGSGLLIS